MPRATRSTSPRRGTAKTRTVEKKGGASARSSSAQHRATVAHFGAEYAIQSPSNLLAYPPLPGPPTGDLARNACSARVRAIVVAVIAWVADLPVDAIGDDDSLSNVTHHLHDPTYATLMSQGLLLSRGQEVALLSGLVEEKWDTVGDLVGALDRVVWSNLHPQGGGK